MGRFTYTKVARTKMSRVKSARSVTEEPMILKVRVSTPEVRE
jgi:hypothetical protein